ncbi:MAG: ImmA/IrrE family metallo-endopeptidase [Syntrophomonadales bacterium]
MQSVTIDINPLVLEWAINNSNYTSRLTPPEYKNLQKWLTKEKLPTLNQLQKFSKRINIPFGYLVLQEPPEDDLIKTDYRTINNAVMNKPSRDLVDTINDMEQKMLWMREYRISIGAEPLPFVGMFEGNVNNPNQIVKQIRKILDLPIHWYSNHPDYNSAFNFLKARIEDTGVLVMKNGVVINNTHRPLDINEFRAFLLFDEFAPLIFINNKDSQGAKIFSLIHEFTHLLTSRDSNVITAVDNEIICNKITADVLMPKELLLELWQYPDDQVAFIDRHAKKLKVSALALAKRYYDIDKIDYATYQKIYEISIQNYKKKEDDGSGGNHYNTKKSNLSETFAKAVINSTLEGQLLHDEAFRLLNVSHSTAFNKLMEMYNL